MSTMNIYDMADEWNDAGTTFTAIKMNVTDTASASDSKLVDLLLGGAGKFSVGKSGDVEAAGSLILRDGPNGRDLLLYNLFTDAGNYERAVLSWSVITNDFIIGTQNGGSGSARTLTFMTGNNARWRVTTGGNLVSPTDSTYDIGAPGANRPRDVHIGRNLKAGGNEIEFPNLPTSDPGVAGRLWNDGGTLKVSAGAGG